MKEGIIPFYSLVRDKISGFEGYVTCRVEHMWDCIRYEVQPTVDEKNNFRNGVMLGGPRLEIIGPPPENVPPAIETPNAFELGVKVKHRISGFVGLAVACVKYPRSGNIWAIEPDNLNDKKEPADHKNFDEEELEQIDPPPISKKERKKPKIANGPNDTHHKPDKPLITIPK